MVFMNLKAMRVLLIGHDPADARAVREALADAQDDSFTVECATRLSDGLERLSRNGIAAVLLDLCLPDSQGIASFEQVWRAAPHIPILVIGFAGRSGHRHGKPSSAARRTISTKAHLDSYSLPRALRHVIERKAAEEALFVEQQRAEVTLNSIGDAVLSIDIPGNVTYLNPVAERMTGWSREEALGRPLAEVFQIIDGATREPASESDGAGRSARPDRRPDPELPAHPARRVRDGHRRLRLPHPRSGRAGDRRRDRVP